MQAFLLAIILSVVQLSPFLNNLNHLEYHPLFTSLLLNRGILGSSVVLLRKQRVRGVMRALFFGATDFEEDDVAGVVGHEGDGDQAVAGVDFDVSILREVVAPDFFRFDIR